jgi:choline dehydrogenase-like flavoprotein
MELAGPVPLHALDLERMAAPEQRLRTRATVIHAIGELHPHEGRYVDLDPEARDALGRPVPRVHVAWTDAERALAEDMANACVQLADALAISGSRLVRFSDPLCAGAGHEAGTCAMGPGLDSVTDGWGRVRELANVWVADAAALPTSGDRHPTLTVLAHALRAADDVARQL